MAVGNATGNAPAAFCLSCGEPLNGVRPARFCSVRCRVRAHRQRHQIAAVPDAQIQPLRRKLRQLDVLYQCGGCGEVYLNDRRCEDCNRFCKRLGVAIECPHCSEPISLEALLEDALEGAPS